MLLVREETWKCVENETPDHPDDEWIQSDLKAQSTISLSVKDSLIVHVCKCESVRDVGSSPECTQASEFM